MSYLNSVLIKGGGEIATAVAHKLHRCGFKVVITEIERPSMVRRKVCFANCIYEKTWSVEGVTSVLINNYSDIENQLDMGRIPVIIDAACKTKNYMNPSIIIDGILAKKNLGTSINDASMVIGLGPGFIAGFDVHSVIETQRGHDLGRVILKGSAALDTGIPGDILGYNVERVLRAPAPGITKNVLEIGCLVEKDDVICEVNGIPVSTSIKGVVRGLIQEGIQVNKNDKIGDIDPRCIIQYCNTISDKGRCIAGGVLEAIYSLQT